MLDKIYRFLMPRQIIFGVNAVAEVANEAAKLGAKNVLIITDAGVIKAGLLEKVEAPLRKTGFNVAVFDKIDPEPPIPNVQDALALAKSEKSNLLIGIGGGSCMDVAKVVSIMLTNEGSIHNYFGIDKVPEPGIPKILIATTSGTGSEVTKYSVLTDPKDKLKKVVVSHQLYADIAIVDPLMSATMPPLITASTGMDALVHAAESYVANNSGPLTDSTALEAIQIIANNLRPAVANGKDMQARYNMALGSLLAGITLNNAGVGAVHALAYPIGIKYHAAHGISNTLVFPEVMNFISIANLPKMARIAAAMGEDIDYLSLREAADKGVEAIKRLIADIELPSRLRDIGAKKEELPELTESAMQGTRLFDNTPRVLGKKDVAKIYERSF